MTSQTGQEIIITIYILPNISRSKGNSAMKFGQIMKIHKYFCQKACKTWDRETSFRPLFVFLNELYIR